MKRLIPLIVVFLMFLTPRNVHAISVVGVASITSDYDESEDIFRYSPNGEYLLLTDNVEDLINGAGHLPLKVIKSYENRIGQKIKSVNGYTTLKYLFAKHNVSASMRI